MTHFQLRFLAICATLAATILVAGCSTPPVITARAAVISAAAVYGASMDTFRVYDGLPPCATNVKPCRDPAGVVKWGEMLKSARVVIKRAEDLVDTLPDDAPLASLPVDQQATINAAATAAATVKVAP